MAAMGTGGIQLLIAGAGGHGKEVLSYVRDLQRAGADLTLRGFVDDHRPPGPFGSSAVLGGLDSLPALLDREPDAAFHYITALGDNRGRQALVERIERLGGDRLKAWTLIHPAAAVGQEAVSIGDGTCVAPGAVVTTHVRIGRHCIVNVNASVSHDSTIGDFACANPRAAVCGAVQIGEGCYLGAGATLIHRVSVGAWTTVGAGAVVIKDLPPGVTAVGVPARIIKWHGDA